MRKFLYLVNKCCVWLFAFKRMVGLHNFSSIGYPNIQIKGNLEISKNTKIIMVNTAKYSTLGKTNPCKVTVYENATLSFSGKVGMSNTTIVATKKIAIGSSAGQISGYLGELQARLMFSHMFPHANKEVIDLGASYVKNL